MAFNYVQNKRMLISLFIKNVLKKEVLYMKILLYFVTLSADQKIICAFFFVCFIFKIFLSIKL